jgi:nucleoid DNA-binding protein
MPRWRKSKTIDHFYKDYTEKRKVDKKTYKNIVKDFFLMLQDHVIEGNTYYVPYGMGEFRISKYKPKPGKSRNYYAEKKYHDEYGIWKHLYFQNFHSDGYRFNLRWFTKDYPLIPAKRVYRYGVNRDFMKKFAKIMHEKGNSGDYYNLTRSTKLSKAKTLI